MLRYVSVLAIVLAALLSSAPLRPSIAAESAPRRVEVVARRYVFTPSDVNLRRGERVILVLKSVDVPHGVRFRELNVDVKAPKGGQGEVQFTPQITGDFVGHCSVFCGSGHGSMTMTLHVSG
jgi:cytochrome c oxidase subunit 2